MPEPAVGTRLQAYLARSGLGSRRACEQLILDGRVTVNGATVQELGTRVSEADLVTLDGREVRPETRLRYLVLNKPAGYVSSMSDEKGRAVAADLIKGIPERVYNVGRLDQWSSGLLLFTNDGAFAASLGHPSGGVEKEYEVQADGPLPPEFFQSFTEGINIDGIVHRARSVMQISPRIARVTLVEGRNREIRRVLERFGRRALGLVRIRIGSITIDGLAAGQFRELSTAEVAALMTSRSIS